ncbi:MAG: pyruvate carboxyltransferase [Defluviitaleaceae bacterium]|nr:pyruvate carboxyltransferase [Defluviitaleaceae bacterium]
MAFREDKKWWVSPSNFDKEVTEKFDFQKNIKILDTTLRDGEQQSGIILTKAEKVAIAKKLDEVGVHRIEAGTPAVSKEDADAVKEIANLGLNADIYCFVRNMKVDVDLAKECGVDGVIAEIPGSEHLLKLGAGWSVEKAINAAIEATSYAHSLGLEVVFFPADGSRASIDFLMDTVEKIVEGGGHMDSLTLVDTFGAFSPEGSARRVRQLKERFPNTPIEIHTHEDFGLGTATALSALAAGASAAHVTVSGIGERAGSAPLEHLVMSLEALYGINTGINLPKLKELAELVEELSKNPIPETFPIVGEKIFRWETGMPSMLWENVKNVEPLVMLPYRWDLVGNKMPSLDIGKKSGNANLNNWLERLGLSVEEEKKQGLLMAIKDESIKLKRTLNEDEFRKLVSQHQ